MVKKNLVFIGFVIVMFLVTFIMAIIVPNDVQNIEKPLTIKGYEIVNTNINEQVFELTLKDTNGDEYLIEYLADDLEDLVCHKGLYEYADVEREYDCSTPEKIQQAMIEELAEQSIEIIEMEKFE